MNSQVASHSSPFATRSQPQPAPSNTSNALAVRGWAFRLALAFLGAGTVLGCDTQDPTYALVSNDYPSTDAGAGTTNSVYKLWFNSTFFRDPIPPASSSDAQRTVPGKDYAYAVLAANWDPSSELPPTSLLALKSRRALEVDRGDTLTISVSDDSFTGNCLSGDPLSQDDADFITQRIFPAEFANAAYDAATCISSPVNAGTGGGGGAGGAGSTETAGAPGAETAGGADNSPGGTAG